MSIYSIALLQEFWSLNKMLDLYTSLSSIIIFLFLFPFHPTEIQQSLSFKQSLVLLSLFCKTAKFYSSSSDDFVNEVLLPYNCDTGFSNIIILFWVPKHMHRSSFQEQLKKHLKIIDLKSGTMCLCQWTAAQPCLNVFGCDLLSWVGLNCDGEIKTIQSLPSNSSRTEIGPYHLPKISISGLLHCLAYSWERICGNGCVFQR